MTFSRVALAITLSLFMGCGDDTSTDAAVAADATSSDVASSSDVTSALDASTGDVGSSDAAAADATTVPDAMSAADVGASDAGSDAATDAGSDAGSACMTRVEDRIAGSCDGRGMRICTDWANEHGGGNAAAQCVRPEGRCARADTCTDDGCTCGGEPECGEAQMCVSGFAGFSCVCIAPSTDA